MSHSENIPITNYQLLLTILLFISVLMWNGCEIINPPESIPAYIQIDTMLLTTNSVQGSASHKIGAVQVNAGAELLGIFPLPTTVPVLQSGEQDIRVDAVVIESGISALRELYPFYQRYTTTGELVEGETLQIMPQTTYNSAANFAFVEDFNGGNSFVDDLDGDPGTRMELTFDDVFEGSASGRIVLNESGSVAMVGTGISYLLPTSGEDVFLEMNYKCNNNFTVGIRGMSSLSGEAANVDKVTFTPRETWNKVYISLSEEAASIGVNQFQIYIKMFKSDDVAIGEVIVDNIKLIHE